MCHRVQSSLPTFFEQLFHEDHGVIALTAAVVSRGTGEVACAESRAPSSISTPASTPLCHPPIPTLASLLSPRLCCQGGGAFTPTPVPIDFVAWDGVVHAGYPSSQVQDMLANPKYTLSARYLDGDIMQPKVSWRLRCIVAQEC